VEDFSLGFYTENSPITVVEDASFEIKKGAILGLVGESGCGKSTLGRLILRLIEADHGEVMLDGTSVLSLSAKNLRRARKKMQMVFQDAMASLDARQKIGRIIAEPLKVHGIGTKNERLDTVRHLLWWNISAIVSVSCIWARL
jgi:ABC-type glutathione transport system ATPase component